MQLRIDVYDANGNKTGSGPIRTAVSAGVTRALDGAGSVSISVPARDSRARGLLVNESRVRIYVDEGAALREVGRGIIRDVSYSAGSGGWELTASGPDMLDELKRRNVKFGRQYVNMPIRDIVADLVGIVPGWDVVCTDDTLYTGRFDGATVLKALQSLTSYAGLHFRVKLGTEVNTVEVGAFGDDAGLRLVNPERLPQSLYSNTQVAAVAALKQNADSGAVANRLYALGAGQNVDSSLDLSAATRNDPPVKSETANGRTLYYLEDAESIAQYGLIEHVGQFKELSPLGNTEEFERLAANALHDAAAAWLARYAVAQHSYSVTLPSAGVSLSTGDKVTLDYVDVVQDAGVLIETLRINAGCWVMRCSESFGAGGGTLSLELSDVDRYERDSAKVVIGALEQIRLQNVSVQQSFNHYTYGPEQLNVDATNAGTVQLIITDKTYRIVQVLMRVRTQPFTSTAKGAGTTTSAGGGDHNHRVLAITSFSGFPPVSPRPYLGRNSSGGAFLYTSFSTNLDADLWTESSSGTHTHTIPSAPLEYGIYRDTQRPGGMAISCNGQTVTTGAGSSAANYDATFDITEYVLSRSGGIRGVHEVVITPSEGRGEVLVTFDVYEIITPALLG